MISRVLHISKNKILKVSSDKLPKIGIIIRKLTKLKR